MHSFYAVDGTTYFAGDEAEWKCFIPKEVKKTKQVILPAGATKLNCPATCVASVHLASVPGVKTLANVQTPDKILSEIYRASFDVKRLSEIPPIFFVAVNVEGCQFQGRGATKVVARRAAAEAALVSIEAIGPVVDRLRARKPKLLGLTHPEITRQVILPAGETKFTCPATFVAPVHLVSVPGVKPCAITALAKIQTPDKILAEIYQASFDVKRLSEIPPIFFVSIYVEGCQFQGRGATKVEARRAAAEAALVSIEAIGPVVDRLRARKAQLLPLKHPEEAIAGAQAAN